MSIIYDALKKVEMSHTDDSKTKIEKGFKPKPKVYLLFALMVCLGLFAANILYEWLIPKHSLNTDDIVTGAQPLIDKKQNVPGYSQPSAGTPPLQTSASVTPPPFALNGVFFSGAEGYALINNRIVKKGDKIDGATVMQISLDEVDLEFGGSIIKLSNTQGKS
ncbi:MAG: hypothetical protein Q8R31_07130 [Candidatus Omnitrophota bacterium]|nr:hypothetical protein [Candidatus Omnitrophota bacterium]